jgi:hypothetical protein
MKISLFCHLSFLVWEMIVKQDPLSFSAHFIHGINFGQLSHFFKLGKFVVFHPVALEMQIMVEI